ncbi:MAG: LamG-like jellyroll fold domain-containing protein [Bacteroidota bacterium]
MRRLSFLIATILSISCLLGQDTLTVQTFEFSDITKRRDWFQFPPDSGSWEKILMEYTIKCDPQTTADGFACGEWDYTTYTNVFNYTGELDSLVLEHPLYIINGSSPDTFYTHTNPVYNTYQTEVYATSLNSSMNEVSYEVNDGSLDFSNSFLGGELSKTQFIIENQELVSAGLSASNIEKLSIEVTDSPANLERLIIRMGHSSESSFEGEFEEMNDLTLVYDGPINLEMGLNEIYFLTPFQFDGSSNLLIEWQSETEVFGNSTAIKSSELLSNRTIFQSQENAHLVFEQGDYLDVPAGAFDQIENEITLSCWVYGDPAIMPANSYIFEGVNSSNQRVLNVHLPWGNGQVYWDAGYLGGYDRINTTAPNSSFEGQWNHWAFTKNAVSGEMKMYLNGQLFHQGNDKTRTMQGIDRFRIGSSANALSSTYYNGFVDEFRVWDAELDQAAIATYMNESVPDDHPYIDNLVLEYSFEGDFDANAIDQSGNGFDAEAFGFPEHVNNTSAFAYNLDMSPIRPDFTFYTGDYEIEIDTTFISEMQMIAATSVQVYSDTALIPMPTEVLTTWESNYGYTYDPNGNIIDSTFYGIDQEYVNDVQAYWGDAFEIVETVQLGNYVTPYGIGLSLGADGWTYIVDVSDYILYLRDSVDLRAHNTQELLDLKFHFIAGTPGREVLSSQIIWNGDWSLAGISENNVLPERAIQLNPSAAHYKIKTRATGHGFGSGLNCSEFCPTDHFVKVNGVEQFNWENWTECADNPIIDQGGTWIYDRAGWCPGAFADTYEWEITPFVTPGEIANIEYGIEPVSIPDGNQRIAFQLIEYGETNFQIDAEIKDILSPTNSDASSKFNPVCDNAQIVIGNRGAQVLTSCTIVYNVEGGIELTYDWQGNLSYGESEIVELPINNSTWWGPTNVFNVRIENPNGQEDEYMNNNVYKSEFESVPQYPEWLEFRFRTNLFPNENEWFLYDGAGDLVYSKSFSDASTTHRDSLILPQGCYRFVVQDYGDDGLSFFANNDGVGYVRIRDIEASNTIISFNPNFGKFIEHQFTVGYTTGLSEDGNNAYIYTYPNPAESALYIEMESFNGSEYTVEMYNSKAQRVKEIQFSNTGSFIVHEMNVSDLTPGIYFLQVRSGNQVKSEKIIIE